VILVAIADVCTLLGVLRAVGGLIRTDHVDTVDTTAAYGRQ
jgi:hypothetical protein